MKYILDGHKVKEVTLEEWVRWYETADRRVAKTNVTDDISVSTVFLGLDLSFGSGPPQLFETMIFGGEQHEYCHRYATWEQAEAGHKIAVALAND